MHSSCTVCTIVVQSDFPTLQKPSIFLGKMARPERFELPTLWFEARCSIQLSYGRVRRSVATFVAPSHVVPNTVRAAATATTTTAARAINTAMLLTITTTHAPATDLGFLLAKN